VGKIGSFVPIAIGMRLANVPPKAFGTGWIKLQMKQAQKSLRILLQRLLVSSCRAPMFNRGRGR